MRHQASRTLHAVKEFDRRRFGRDAVFEADMELVKWPARRRRHSRRGRQNQDHVSGRESEKAGLHDGRESRKRRTKNVVPI